jgi:acyl-CoA thioesterase-1
MRLSTFLISLLLLIASVIAVKHYRTPASPLKELKAGATILAFGDSLTYGYGALPHESYPAILEQKLHRTVINAGIPGELSEQGLKRLSPLLQKYHPDILILCHGGNDLLRKKSLASLRYNLEQMIRLARSQHVDVILIAVPEFGLLHLTPAPVYGELAKEYRLPVEPDVLSDLLHDNRYKSDYIHPNAAGYEKMAEAVEKIVREKYRVEE